MNYNHPAFIAVENSLTQGLYLAGQRPSIKEIAQKVIEAYETALSAPECVTGCVSNNMDLEDYINNLKIKGKNDEK